MSAGCSKPATRQFCCGTAVEVAAAALSATQVKADTPQLRCFILRCFILRCFILRYFILRYFILRYFILSCFIPLFGIVLLRLASGKSRPCALVLSKSALPRVVLD